MLGPDGVSPLCRPQQRGPGESGQYYSGPVPQRLRVQQGGRAHLLHHHPGESSSCPDGETLQLGRLSLGWARRGFAPALRSDPSASFSLLALAPMHLDEQPASTDSCNFPASLGNHRRVSRGPASPKCQRPPAPLTPPFHPSVLVFWARRQRANKPARASSGGAC